jgi:hypothetical protein
MAAFNQRGMPDGDRYRTSYLYRILTEEKNVDQVKGHLIAQGIDYTIFYGEGAWEGGPEHSMAIELANITRSLVESVAIVIMHLNDQKAVFIQEVPIRTLLLLASDSVIHPTELPVTGTPASSLSSPA